MHSTISIIFSKINMVKYSKNVFVIEIVGNTVVAFCEFAYLISILLHFYITFCVKRRLLVGPT
jgi:hypothetical protein